MPEEYSVALWVNGQCLMQLCVGRSGSIQTMQDAAAWGYRQAVERSIIKQGDAVELDVSEDASDEWFTHPLTKA